MLYWEKQQSRTLLTGWPREAGLGGYLKGRLAVNEAIKSLFMAAEFSLDEKNVHREETK